ncbi:uncharacterized protein LOC18447599 [Amborella trichopoda]|nr:uncharacterized protein LOC18447599 [Amborella trichopoda]|eukprot:XP_006857755.2 uncharacterized protein LOC18447599 [Amborella trichopoda]
MTHSFSLLRPYSLTNCSPISYNLSSFHPPFRIHNPQYQNPNPRISRKLTIRSHLPLKNLCKRSNFHHPLPFRKVGSSHLCRDSIENQETEDPISEFGSPLESERGISENNGGTKADWTTSVLLFGLWGVLMYYVFLLSPNQTPSRDDYFLQKLLNLKGDDGFVMNQVLVCLWYIMGLWPLIYAMLLIPSGRSTESKIPVWPFVLLSCFGGAYALLPYFVLWRPPPPTIEEAELGQWPLNFLDSKITSVALALGGLGLIIYAGLASGDTWKEFYQYFRESKLVHITSLDFSLLSAFAPFWVYNDMTVRKWYDKGSWLLPLTLIPFLGPVLYLVFRPSLSEITPVRSAAIKEE